MENEPYPDWMTEEDITASKAGFGIPVPAHAQQPYLEPPAEPYQPPRKKYIQSKDSNVAWILPRVPHR